MLHNLILQGVGSEEGVTIMEAIGTRARRGDNFWCILLGRRVYIGRHVVCWCGLFFLGWCYGLGWRAVSGVVCWCGTIYAFREAFF